MENIVVINEDLKVLNEISKILKEFNYNPFMFQDVDEAFKFLGKKQPFLLITDLFFRKYNPFDIWERIKSYNLDNVLIISNEASNELGSQVIRDGAIDYLLNPVEKEQIRLIIAKLKLKNRKNKLDFTQIITNNVKMKMVLKIVESAAKSRSTVLIRGESGVGKELIAKMIHEKSPRKDMPFVAVNCAALPENLLESELFGHEKGSFTGAISTKLGKFEIANNGTILLDEITEMPFPLQAKLLRVLQEREIDRVGGRTPIKVDIRVIATTNRNMKEIIEEKEFREDLYYRLNVIPIIIPPLRERKDDIKLLADFFIKKHCSLNNINEKNISENAVKKLLSYDWPGNVRELENIIERAVIICPDNTITETYILFEDELENIYNENFYDTQGSNKQISKETDENDSLLVKPGLTISEMEKKLIIETLKSVNSNRTLAAELLGISVRTLRNKLNEYKKEGIVI